MPRLTLTFDNGPDPDVTSQVLDCLAARRLPATFFVVGQRLRRPGGRSVLEAAARAGHRIGNHSMTHTTPLGLDPSLTAVDDEIVATQDLLGDLAGPDLLFRPFGGGGRLGPHLFSPAAVRHLVAARYTVVLWNSVPRDWEDPEDWPERALRDVDRQEWTVLVLHDVVADAMKQLPAFLDRVVAKGVEVVRELPDDCVPIRDGLVRQDLGALTA